MSAAPRMESAALPLPLARQVEAAYQRFESAWRAGQRPLIEDHLGSLPEPARTVLLPELLELELSCRRRAGETVRAGGIPAALPGARRADRVHLSRASRGGGRGRACGADSAASRGRPARSGPRRRQCSAPSPGPLPRHGPARRRRLRRGLQGPRRRPAARRGHQGAAPPPHRHRRPTSRPTWPRPACWRPSTTRASCPSTTWAAPPTASATSSPSSSTARTCGPAAAGPARLRGGGGPRRPGGRGPAPRPPPRPGPPRRQAGQHPARRRRPARAWPTSAWPCARRTSARAPSWPARRRT